MTLAPEQTEPLLTQVPAAFHAGVNDVLLTALALAVIRWRRRGGDMTETADCSSTLEATGAWRHARRRAFPYGRLVHQPYPVGWIPGASMELRA